MNTSTTDNILGPETKTVQENILLDIIKEVCGDPNTKLSQKLVGKVKRIIADCDLTHHASFHKLVTSIESTTTVLGKLELELELDFLVIFHFKYRSWNLNEGLCIAFFN